MAILISVTTPVKQLVLSGTNMLSAPGTSTTYVSDQGGGVTQDATSGGLSTSGTYVLGVPATIPNSVVPTNYIAYLAVRATLGGAVRVTTQGTGRIQLTDDFGTRARISLTGVNP